MYTTETQLIIPAIMVIRAYGGVCDTNELISGIKTSVKLTPQDLSLLPSGKSLRIEQKIRNLRCNEHLERLGLAVPYDGGFMLTELGLTIGDIELENMVIKRYSKSRVVQLSMQGTLAKYIIDSGIVFNDTATSVRAIASEFDYIPDYSNNRSRMAAVRAVTNKYIADNPDSIT